MDAVPSREEERPGFVEDYDSQLTKARGIAPPVPDSEIERRLELLRELLRRDDLDAITVFGSPQEPSWIRYLANYIHPLAIGESFLFVARSGDPILFIDRDWFLPQAREMTPYGDVRVFPYVELPWQFPKLVEAFAEGLGDIGVREGRVGICELVMPAVYARALQETPLEVEFTDATSLLGQLIEVKSDYDAEMVRRAASIADAAMWEALRTCAAGVPEYEVGIAAERVAAARGAEGGGGTTTRNFIYIGSGSEVRSNVRPYKFTGRTLEPGDMFFVDLSVCYRGYYADFCRTVVVGEPSNEQRTVFDAVAAHHRDLLDGLRPGMTGDEVFRLGMESVEKHSPEYRDFVNFVWFGHGTGVVVSEPPFFTHGEERELSPNTFVNIEPGLFVPDVGSCALEDMLFLTEDGASLVTECPRELHVAPPR